jgi:hypothetical protein
MSPVNPKTSMNITQTIVRLFLLICFAAGMFALPAAVAADANPAIPAIIQNGFKSWAVRDASYAFDVWKKGGLLETDVKPAQLARYFGQVDNIVGKYKSYETVETKTISASSRIIYLSINFEQAAVYARFLVYRKDSGWVIQNMDFSPKPEAIMPWLAFAGENYGQ